MKKIMLFVLVGFSLTLFGCGQQVLDNETTSSNDNLAKCLTEKGAKMYGTETCPYCLQQKDLFGKSFSYINYINCGETPEICGEANIQGVPAWEFADGSQKAGLQSLENLATFAGCEYTK